MPPRSKAPGLKGGRYRPELGKRLPYWYAKNVVRDPMGFPDPCIALPPEATEAELIELCQAHSARLFAWIDEQQRAVAADAAADAPLLRPYDGTVDSACDWYEQHPRTRFRKVKANTRRTYLDSLKVVRGTIGKRLIRNLTIFDVQDYYDLWRQPKIAGGRERIDRAHNAVTMFKTVLRFNAALRRPDCAALLADLDKATSMVSFEKGGARTEEMTFSQARAFIEKALDLGRAGLLPADRMLYMAIGVATQFELVLRPKDIIGERPKTLRDRDKAVRRGAAAIDYGGQIWTGYFTWENIPGWQWRMRTSKSKYRAPANFDLTIYPLLFPLLEAVPQEQRAGAVVKGEHGHAVQERSYRKWYRAIARVAGIPDAVWNMDARAGAATEAEEAGAELGAIRALLTHSEKQEATTVRYLRRRDKQRVAVQEVRNRSRQEGGT
ncbi:MAG TPA: hypothetical protein VHV56_02290 [Pseudolabrys sp.]|nr:hypothetical protein [Pseudolabrys sp.]